ncbi:MAG: hypothetical protein Kow0092_25670 [Deferrisomatales bacterium]
MKKTLLVVDDSATIRQAVEQALTGEDWEVVAVAGREAALQQVQSHRFDAVLCDAALGEADGYALCAELRESGPGEPPPVILMGAGVKEGLALNAGAAAVLPKPFEAQELLAALGTATDEAGLEFDLSDFEVDPGNDEPSRPGELEGGAETHEEEVLEIIDLSSDEEFGDLELLEGLEPISQPPEELPGGGLSDSSFDLSLDTESAPGAAAPFEVSDQAVPEGPSALQGEALGPSSAGAGPLELDALDLEEDLPGAGEEPAPPDDGEAPFELELTSWEEERQEDASDLPDVSAEGARPGGDTASDEPFELELTSWEEEEPEDAPEADQDLAYPEELAIEEEPSSPSVPASSEPEPAPELLDQGEPEAAAPPEAPEEGFRPPFPGEGAEEPEIDLGWEAQGPEAMEPSPEGEGGEEEPPGPEEEGALEERWAAPEPSSPEGPEAYLDEPVVEAPSWPPPEPMPAAGPGWDVGVAPPAGDGIAAAAEQAVRRALETGLSAEKLTPVVAEVVERVVWEVVPQLAERLIQEAIDKLREHPPTAP